MSMSATVIDITDHSERAAARTRATLRQVRDYRGLRTDDSIAAATGLGRSAVQRFQTGRTKLTVEVIASFAAALNIPDHVLVMEPEAAMSWIYQNRPNGPTGGGTRSDQAFTESGWIADTPGQIVAFPASRAA